MSSNLNVHLGAYIKVVGKHTRQEKIRYCLNEERKKRKIKVTTDFCSACGSKIIDDTYPVTEKLSWFTFRDKFGEKYGIGEDDFYEPEYLDIWISNSYGIKDSVDIGDDDDSETDLSEINPTSYKAALRMSKEGMRLIKAFDEEKIEYKLCFGIFKYWS